MTQGHAPLADALDAFLERVGTWYAADHHGFRTLYDAAVRNVVPCPQDTPQRLRCEWRDRDVGFLRRFLREWYEWRPGPDDGLDYIARFSWLTYENDYGMVFATCGPGARMLADFTELQGRRMDSPQSRDLVEKWIAELGPERMADYREPEGGWPHFNAFFTRELKDGARPVDAPDDGSVVVAPADCVINMIVDELTDTTPIPVKSVAMNVGQLLDGSPYAARFIGGTAVSCILLPDAYHWYHAPVAGRVVEARDDVGGVHYGTREFPEWLNRGNVGGGYDHQEFGGFRRGYLVIETPYPDTRGRRGGEGYVAQVPVGLNSVSSVNFLGKFRDVGEPVAVAKGERIGNFRYGGSLNILLFEPGRFPALQLLQGRRIGRLEAPERTAGLFTAARRARSGRR